jgi:hypothetical protein
MVRSSIPVNPARTPSTSLCFFFSLLSPSDSFIRLHELHATGVEIMSCSTFCGLVNYPRNAHKSSTNVQTAIPVHIFS